MSGDSCVVLVAAVLQAAAVVGVGVLTHRLNKRNNEQNTELSKRYADAVELANRIALFPQRYSLLEATRAFLLAIGGSAEITSPRVHEPLRIKDEGQYVLDQEILDRLGEMHKRAIAFHQSITRLESNGLSEDERKRMSADQNADIFWFNDQLVEVPKLFAKHLKVAD